MTDSSVLLAVDNHVATITLNRPDKLNAATFDMSNALQDAFRRIEEDDDIRVVVVTGAGKAFCAGDDVEEAWGDARMEPLLKELGDVRPAVTPETAMMLGCTKPTIAAVNGVALGIGMDIAVMCDIRIASEHARFALLYVKLGLMPDVATYWRLPQLVGPETAIRLALTGEFVDAAEAARIGLVSQVVTADDLLPTANRLAASIAAHSPVAVRHIKEAFRRGTGRPYTDLPDVATFVGNGLARLFQSDEHRAAADAFRNRARA